MEGYRGLEIISTAVTLQCLYDQVSLYIDHRKGDIVSTVFMKVPELCVVLELRGICLMFLSGCLYVCVY